MSEKPFSHPRWGDSLAPTTVSRVATYSVDAHGPVSRAALYDGDELLGHVWTDGLLAAGFLPVEQAGISGRNAATKVWIILRDAYRTGRPASKVLDQELFAGEFILRLGE